MTSHTTPPEFSWLDLGPSDTVTDLGTFQAPVPSVGLGLAVHALPPEDGAAAWAARIDAAPDLEPAPIAPGRGVGVEAGWWADARPPVLVVQRRGATLVPLEGAIDLGDGRLVLGAGGRPSRCRIIDDAAELALQVERGALRCFEIHRPAPAWATEDEVADLERPHPIAIDALLAGWESAPWLRTVAHDLASSGLSLDVAAAGGLVLRLWSSPPEARGASMTRLLAGEASPPDRVRSWLHAAPEGWAADAQATALLEADHLREDIDLAVGRSEPGLLRSLVLRRDDLESVLAALDVTGAAGGLRAALEPIDAVMTTHLDLPIDDELADDERIAAVSWMDPAAWWGTLAGR